MVSVSLTYFDTVPVASSICILKNGFIFFACDKGNHLVYKIRSLCDSTDTVINYFSKKVFRFVNERGRWCRNICAKKIKKFRVN